MRPIEEFRHTPIIPISDKDLREHKKKIDEANRKGYYVEIKKDTIYFYGNNCQINNIAIALLALGLISYAFILVNEK